MSTCSIRAPYTRPLISPPARVQAGFDLRWACTGMYWSAEPSCKQEKWSLSQTNVVEHIAHIAWLTVHDDGS
jgi:hypothetical protein